MNIHEMRHGDSTLNDDWMRETTYNTSGGEYIIYYSNHCGDYGWYFAPSSHDFSEPYSCCYDSREEAIRESFEWNAQCGLAPLPLWEEV